MRNKRGLIATTVAVTVGILGVVLPAQASVASTPLLTTLPAGVGVDISFPQCDFDAYPSRLPFMVVGVNGGKASTNNSCFTVEYNTALTRLDAPASEQPSTSVYLNTGNPALLAAWWPSSNETQIGVATQDGLVTIPSVTVSNPNGSCTHTAGAACAYVYGYSMAHADYANVLNDKVALPTLWWLDVETTNTWQTDLAANEASLDGMVDYLHSVGRTVGIYSTSYQWNKIAGVTKSTSTLAGLQSWLAGSSPTGAAAACEGTPLTPGGRVSMVQYVSGNLDNDLSCHVFPSAVKITPSATQVVGVTLSATTGWPAGGTYAYQWRRNGAAIPHATASKYTVTSADAGKAITYTVTGKKLGYSTETVTSSAVTVRAARPVAPAPRHPTRVL